MVLGMLFENFKNYYILRYVIYEFLKKVLGVPQPTCLVRVHCAQVNKACVEETGLVGGYSLTHLPPNLGAENRE